MDMCRTCLKTPAENNISELNKKYPNIMPFCLDIKVSADSKITTNLCYCCYRKVIAFYKFKTRSLKNDAYLKTLDPAKLVDQKPNENEVKQEKMLDAEEFGESLAEDRQVEIKIEVDGIKDDDEMDETTTPLADVNFESDEEPLSTVQKVKYEFVKEETEVKAPKKRARRKNPKTPKRKKIKAETNESRMCEECGKSVKNLKEHSLQHRPREERPMLRCKLCPKEFISVGGRNRHYKTTHLGVKSKCDICNKEYLRLAAHMLQVHNRDALRFGCVLCGRRFIAQSTLDFHMLSHTKDNQFECDVCHKKYRSKSFLSRHIRQVHDKEKPHQCHVCSKAFFKKDDLQRHMRIHTQERPFACEECGKAFNDKRTLQNHVLVHGGVRKYRCKICDAAFIRPGYLSAHMISHTKEKRHPCRYCGVRFGRSDHRNRHEFTAHQKLAH